MKSSQDDKAVISAFTEEQTSRLTGLSVARLRYWDRTGFFQPAFADQNRRVAYSRVYSFTDLTALRVIHVLINQYNVPLRHLREVAAKLSGMGNSAWAETTLYVLNKKVIFDDGEVNRQREVVSGQYMIGLPLETVVSDTKRDIRTLSERSEAQIGHTEKHRRVAHNAEVIAGTRIPVRAISSFLDDGYSIDDILKEYPTLKRKDIQAVKDRERVA